jgi:hypothetical protein
LLPRRILEERLQSNLHASRRVFAVHYTRQTATNR